MTVVNDVVQICGVFLNIVLLVLLSRGFLRKYPILFAYGLVQLLVNVSERLLQQYPKVYRIAFWTGEIVWDVLLFILVAELIQRTLAGRPERAIAQKILVIVIASVLVLPFLLFYQRPFLSLRWLSGTSQLLNFGAAILTLVLWGALIASRNRDRQLMTVCVGLGIYVTGSAFSWGIIQLSAGTSVATTMVDVSVFLGGLTWVAGLAVWCYAFWPKPKAPAPVSSSSAKSLTPAEPDLKPQKAPRT